MAQDVKHINMTEPVSETVYCHYQGDIVKFDGVHVANICWGCPFWAGLAGGFGVECIYDDANATQPEVVYTKPATAKAEAPERVEDADSIASTDGIAARDARVKLSPAVEDATTPVEEETPTEEAAPTEEVPEGTPTAPAVPTKTKAPVMPSAPVKKKNPVPPQFRKANSVDVLTEMIKVKSGGQAVTKTNDEQEVLVLSRADAEKMFVDMPELKSWLADDISLDVIVKARSKKEGMDTSDPGLFTRCMETVGAQKASDPAAYCAAVHKKITGEWPGEHRGEKKK